MGKHMIVPWEIPVLLNTHESLPVLPKLLCEEETRKTRLFIWMLNYL
jgi:hypothetical protein